MGFACTRSDERALAAKGLSEAQTRFYDNNDISSGGVLFALPALLENGLISHLTKHFTAPAGYYNIIHIFLTIAYMALTGHKSLENLRNIPPGELGRLMGLDRVPEVKKVRGFLSQISAQKQARTWSAELSKEWMEADSASCGVLYVDGHVRVYNGKKTNLPSKYVARQRLCLRGVSDYWVNDFLHRPLFVVRKEIDPGLIKVLKTDIIPDLLRMVPDQPDPQELAANSYRSRFMIVFDREGYSPDFFLYLWEHRITFCTYRKYVKDSWSLEEFRQVSVKLQHKETIDMVLAERGTFLGGKIWVREIRKLTKSGHQISLISTDFNTEIGKLAVAMFNRWGQENFFKYMMEHYGIDRLTDYDLDDISDTNIVVNPEYRELDSRIRSLTTKLHRTQVNFMSIGTPDNLTESRKMKINYKKAELLENIDLTKSKIVTLKEQKKKVKRHILFRELTEEQKFKMLSHDKKLIVDTIKMICYRAETCLVAIARERMANKDESRSLVRQIIKSSVDYKVDKKNNRLNIYLHNLPSKHLDATAQKICEELNKSETYFPGINLRLCYNLVTSHYP